MYKATQERPNRVVALKVIRAGISSRQALRRFEYESEILARLQHPNIAQVYEAATYVHPETPGRAVPYVAMEYIPDAKTITEHAKDEKLGVDQCLELFIQVCHAVNYGHQKGVIHRDLKPANILVDSSGHVKVIDFGVARSTDSDISVTTIRTDLAQLIGTLQYMSPEQCAADPRDLDTRSDVFALGVVLYELLCRRLPYDVSHLTIQSAARVICEQAPIKPSAFDRRLRGDPETIVLKALEKDREKRYQSAVSLAEDVRRYLKGDLIEARSPSAWMRAVRWVRRRPIAATAIGCVSLATVIIAATFFTVWLFNSRPYEIVRYRTGEIVEAEDGQPSDQARLLSFNGRPLQRWGGSKGAIYTAQLLDRPTEFGGGKLALIGYSNESVSEFRGSLCGYAVDSDRDVPVWTRRLETEDILAELRRERNFVGEQFYVRWAKIADVFQDPDHPGDEVVAVFGNFLSQRVIRIYDLAGTLLYQAWHDGSMGEPYWMPEARLLVFAGDNAMVNWDRKGNLLKAKPNPIVVFALRPEPGHIGDNWLSLKPGDEPGSTAWYKCIRLGDSPVTRDDVSRLELRAPFGADSGRSVRLNLSVTMQDEVSVAWVIDEFGNEVPDSRSVGDSYQIDQASPEPALPDPGSFHLGELPPMARASGTTIEHSTSEDDPS